jgi:N-acetyl-gamma-glutamyl-phosphate reductase
MTTIFIDGAHGTTGLEIVNRLETRPEFALIVLDDRDRKNDSARREALNDADVAILCLPDDAAHAAAAMVENDRTVIIDASSAHRTVSGWTFGFHEIFSNGLETLRSSKRISNPGCYPTGFLALIKPLTDAAIIPVDALLTVNAVSGYSGGGKAMIAEFEAQGRAATAWRTYGLNLAHKHVPEMQRHAGLVHPPIFSPSVANTYRGMIVEVPLCADALAKAIDHNRIKAALARAYSHTPLINVISDYEQADLAIEYAAGRDHLDLFVFANTGTGQIRLVAALDNLGKGAAGACVQTLNIVTGYPETTGLRL